MKLSYGRIAGAEARRILFGLFGTTEVVPLLQSTLTASFP